MKLKDTVKKTEGASAGGEPWEAGKTRYRGKFGLEMVGPVRVAVSPRETRVKCLVRSRFGMSSALMDVLYFILAFYRPLFPHVCFPFCQDLL
jgi:hypothetical protein